MWMFAWAALMPGSLRAQDSGSKSDKPTIIIKVGKGEAPTDKPSSPAPQPSTQQPRGTFDYTLRIGTWEPGTGQYTGDIAAPESRQPNGPSGFLEIREGPCRGVKIYAYWKDGVPKGLVEVTFPSGWRWQAKDLESPDTKGAFISGPRRNQEATFILAYRESVTHTPDQQPSSPGPFDGYVRVTAQGTDGENLIAFIWEGDRVLGQSGQKIAMTIGTHPLRVECSGYKTVKAEAVVSIGGDPREIPVKLPREESPVTINTIPPGVEIRISRLDDDTGQSANIWTSDDKGVLLGKGLTPGVYQLKATKADWKPYAKTITVPKDGITLEVRMDPEPYVLTLTVDVAGRDSVPVDVSVENATPESLTSGVSKQIHLPVSALRQVTLSISSEGCQTTSRTLPVQPGGRGDVHVSLKFSQQAPVTSETIKTVQDDTMVLGVCEGGTADYLLSNLHAYQERVRRSLGASPDGLSQGAVADELEAHFCRLAKQTLKVYCQAPVQKRDGQFLEVARGAVFNAAILRGKPIAFIMGKWRSQMDRVEDPARLLPWWLVSPTTESPQTSHAAEIRAEDSQPLGTKLLPPSSRMGAVLPTRAKIILGWVEQPVSAIKTESRPIALTLCLTPEGSMRPRLNNGKESNETFHLASPFYMSEREITVGALSQYVIQRDGLAGRSGELSNLMIKVALESLPRGKDDQPVDNVTPDLAFSFCNWLSLKTGYPPSYERDAKGNWSRRLHAQGTGFRLPAAMEWQYAARYGFDFCAAPDTTPWLKRRDNFATVFSKEGVAKLPVDLVYFCRPAIPPRAASVSSRAYPLGFFDLCGNVKELCADWEDQGRIIPSMMGGAVDVMDPDAVMPWAKTDYDTTDSYRGFRVVLPCEGQGLFIINR